MPISIPIARRHIMVYETKVFIFYLDEVHKIEEVTNAWFRMYENGLVVHKVQQTVVGDNLVLNYLYSVK